MRLTSAARSALPKKTFGLPAQRKFPMPDRSHAAVAKSRASQAVNAGRMAPGTEAKIDAKANAVMGHRKQSVATVKTDRGSFGIKG